MIPQDIMRDAERKFPVEMMSTFSGTEQFDINSVRRQFYIAYRTEERELQREFQVWANENFWNYRSYDDTWWNLFLKGSFTYDQLFQIFLDDKTSKK